MKFFRFFSVAAIAFSAIGWTSKEPILKNGIYRSVVTRPDGKDIVFNIEAKDSAGKRVVYVLNAQERLLVDNITSKDDSLLIQMPFFESAFKVAVKTNGDLSGCWIKQYGDKVQLLPFNAAYNQKQRFVVRAKPLFNATGKWDATFTAPNGEAYKAIGEFLQKGNVVTGTFRTTSGDYRYLQGVVNGDSLMLSAFDGGHAFLFTGKINSSNVISNGSFYSGANVFSN